MAHKTTTGTKKHFWIYILATVMVVLFLAAALFIYGRSDIVYRLEQDIKAAMSSFSLDAVTIETQELSAEELFSDPRCQSNQSLLLINKEYRIPDNFSPDIAPYRDTDVLMNVCIQDAYAALASNVENTFGQKLYINSAYRTAEDQLLELAESENTATEVGASEHQAGLALDVYLPSYAGMALLKTEAGRYVNDHCQEYGFIIRYPSYGQSETGLGYEPWHLRYVGCPHAEIIMNNYLTLESYMQMLETNIFYQSGNYLISRQQGDTFIVPTSYQSVLVSEDNMGGYILTFLLT